MAVWLHNLGKAKSREVIQPRSWSRWTSPTISYKVQEACLRRSHCTQNCRGRQEVKVGPGALTGTVWSGNSGGCHSVSGRLGNFTFAGARRRASMTRVHIVKKYSTRSLSRLQLQVRLTEPLIHTKHLPSLERQQASRRRRKLPTTLCIKFCTRSC